MSLTSTPTDTWGTFLEPASELREAADLQATLNVRTYSGHRARFTEFRGQNRIFDAIVRRIADTKIPCEDQCSAKHYADVFDVVRAHYGRANRIVEVGVYLGGATQLFAGCLIPMDMTLDLVDVNASFLQFAAERARRTFPESADRVRMFHGDLPTYVDRVLLADTKARSLVHHDGSHDFTQVVKDLSALSFVKERLLGVMLQDTHLRGTIEWCNFVDAAIYAVFGFDVNLVPMGSAYPAGHELTNPNQYQGNYFMPGAAEGAFVSMESNTFKYPHPSLKLEDFLPKRA